MKTKTTNSTTTATTGITNGIHARILHQYGSVEDFAARTNVSLDKLAGNEEFLLEDIIAIRTALNLDEKEVKEYFFPDWEPQEKQYAMIDLLTMQGIISRLEKIEDGLTALGMMTTGRIKDNGSEISEEDFQNAFDFVMDQIMDKLTDLRAELTGKYFLERERIGQ